MAAREKEYKKVLTKADQGIYVYIPIEIDDDTERLEIDYDYSPWKPEGSAWKNDVDVLVVDEQGNDVGTRGSVVRNIVISPYYSTPGFDVRKINKGVWNVVVLPARMISDEVDFSLVIRTFPKERKWLRGETHSHTHNSDGNLSYEQLIKKANKLKMDFLFITDHNRTILNMPKSMDYLTVVPGLELTYVNGHANVWGVQVPYSGSFITNDQEGFLKIKEEAESKGALVSINHPHCSKCGWHWPLDNFEFDCIEIWNGFMRLDNLKTIHWWHEELKKGRRLSAVGGSDFHKDYYVIPIFANPTTHILSEGREPEDILRAIKEGRTTMTTGPDTTFIEIKCGNAVVGDEVVLKEGMKATVSVANLKRNHELRVVDSEGVIYTHKAKCKENHVAEIPVRGPGFVRAEVMYNLKGIKKFLFNIGLKLFMPAQAFTKHPPMVYAICSPIWFVKE